MTIPVFSANHGPSPFSAEAANTWPGAGPADPSWVRHEGRYLDAAMFVPSDTPLRDYPICVSPVAYRARLIFTGPDPLQRARFPYHLGVITMPADHPVRSDRDGK